MTFGFPSGSKNFCELLWVSCEVLFLHGYAGQILHNDSISVIVSRFAIVTEDLVICCYQECSARGTAPPLRLLHGALVILVLWQISQFRSLGKCINTVLTQILTSLEYGLQRHFTRRTDVRISVCWNFIIHQIFPEFLQPLRDFRACTIWVGRPVPSWVPFLNIFFDFLLAWSISFRGKVQVHQNHFHQKKISSSKTTFIKNHFHQKPISSKNQFHQKTTFIKKPLSSKTSFIKDHFHQKPISSETNFIRNHFHQKPFSSEKMKRKGGTVNIVRVCVKVSPAEGGRCSTWRSVEGRKAGV